MVLSSLFNILTLIDVSSPRIRVFRSTETSNFAGVISVSSRGSSSIGVSSGAGISAPVQEFSRLIIVSSLLISSGIQQLRSIGNHSQISTPSFGPQEYGLSGTLPSPSSSPKSFKDCFALSNSGSLNSASVKRDAFRANSKPFSSPSAKICRTSYPSGFVWGAGLSGSGTGIKLSRFTYFSRIIWCF